MKLSSSNKKKNVVYYLFICLFIFYLILFLFFHIIFTCVMFLFQPASKYNMNTILSLSLLCVCLNVVIPYSLSLSLFCVSVKIL